jgi:hypothetical protein
MADKKRGRKDRDKKPDRDRLEKKFGWGKGDVTVEFPEDRKHPKDSDKHIH